ncbi:hypothetical protein [Streptomyces melanosporofaciens]|nr:hypothetical protein [Streptomyces melanosporofaciens]
MDTSLTRLVGVRHPLVQTGMEWPGPGWRRPWTGSCGELID